MDPHFTKLNIDSIVNAYEISESRAILLDYDGTLVPQTSINKPPSPEVVSIINTLCSDRRNIVFLVSGRDKDTLGEWFASCPKLGIAAEHGYFLRYVLFHFCTICEVLAAGYYTFSINSKSNTAYPYQTLNLVIAAMVLSGFTT